MGKHARIRSTKTAKKLLFDELERDALGRDTGPGLTDLGKELIDACNLLRILIDLSHLNERGFWDVAAISNAPLVATHSNDEVTAKYRAWVVRQYFTSGVVG